MINKRVLWFSCFAALSVAGMLGCDSDSSKEKKPDEPVAQGCEADCGSVAQGYTCDAEKNECNCGGVLCDASESCEGNACVANETPAKLGCSDDCNAVMAGYTCDEAKQECNCGGSLCGPGAYCTQDGCVRERGELFVQAEDGNLVVEEGGTNAVRLVVTLSMAPTSRVTLSFPYAGSDDVEGVSCEGPVKGKAVTIEPENWEAGAVITCKHNGGINHLVETDKDVLLEITSFSQDAAFQDVKTSANLVLKEMDEAKIVLSTPDNLYTSEDGASVELGVSLAADPGHDCTLDVSLANDDGSSEPYAKLENDKVLFESNEYLLHKTIKVTGLDDGNVLNDTAHAYHVIIRPGEGCEGPFKDMPEASIGLVNLDNDAVNMRTDVSNFEVKEEGTKATIQVTLSPAPEADTIVSVTSDNPKECGIYTTDSNPPSETEELLFKKGEDAPIAVTIVGVDDNIDDGNVKCHITLTATSEDKNPETTYNGKSLTITGQNIDDDTADILGFALDAKTIYERNIGGTNYGTMSLSLATEPTADVKFALSATNADGDDKDKHVMLSVGEMTFTPQDYNTPRLLFYIAVWDQKSTGNKWVAINEKATSEDKNYNKWNKTVKVKVIDEDVPGVSAELIGGTILREDEPSVYKEVKVTLGTKPTKDVTVTAKSNSYYLRVSKAKTPPLEGKQTTLTFAPDEWQKPQSLYVFPNSDGGMIPGDQKAKLELSTMSHDPKYWNLTADIPEFTIIDADVKDIKVDCTGKATCSSYTTTGECVVSLDSSNRPKNNETLVVACTSAEVGYWWMDSVNLNPENNYTGKLTKLISKKCAQKTETEYSGTAKVHCEFSTSMYWGSGDGSLSYGWNKEPWE
ncbi:MAG: hypothetical protein IKY83_10190 [Proteobacteria bacterium]|nr:hypothetical protein [Pseudomonadota bacterium]